jgi:TatD DNase family protein
MAGDMTEKGIYISVGNRLLGNKKKCREVLNNIPSEFLFLETDEDEISIKKVYSEVSECMDIPVSELKKLIYKNFQKAFLI